MGDIARSGRRGDAALSAAVAAGSVASVQSRSTSQMWMALSRPADARRFLAGAYASALT